MPTRRVVLISVGLLFMLGVFLAMAVGLFLVSPAKKGVPAQVVIVRERQTPWELAEDLEKKDGLALLRGLDGILVPGGFGDRGTEGKIAAARYAREHRVPYYGLCLGLQIAVIEFARNVLKLKGANSTEFEAAPAHPVINMMEEQKKITDKGATMRLGSYDCALTPGTHAARAYRVATVRERHRHRYEVNNAYVGQLQRAGMMVSGLNPRRNLVEIVELKNHPWFLAVQFHPEFQSKPNRAHPLFAAFIAAALKNQKRPRRKAPK